MKLVGRKLPSNDDMFQIPFALPPQMFVPQLEESLSPDHIDFTYLQ